MNGYNGIYSDGIQRNPGAKWFIPNEDEWYKAAYYNGGSTDAGYWDFSTQGVGITHENATYESGAPNDVGRYPTRERLWTFDQAAT